MKTIILAVLVLLTTTALAQAPRGTVSMEVGLSVTAWLGMPRPEIVRKMASAGFKQVPLANGTIMFRNGDDIASISFKNDKIVFAERTWSREASNAFHNTMAGLSAFADSSEKNCAIVHQPINEPDLRVNRIFIVCGERSFLLIEGEVAGKPTFEISERIGEP